MVLIFLFWGVSSRGLTLKWCRTQAVTGTHGARVRGNLAALLEQSAAVVRGAGSLPALITARIDRLRPSQQLTLKARRLLHPTRDNPKP